MDDLHLIGAQRPAYYTAPYRHRERKDGCARCGDMDYKSGCGNHVAEEVLDWASQYWDLDDWQVWSLTEGLGVKPNYRWAAKEWCEILPRQNGKGTILEVRELAGLYILGEKEITHTAHLFPTAQKHFIRCLEIVENNPDLSKWVKKVNKTHGQEALVLKAKPTRIFGPRSTQVTKSFDQILQFIARNGKQGRGFTSNCIVYDESMFLTPEDVGASRPALRSVANHQIIVMGSAGKKDSIEEAKYHNRILDEDPTLFGAEWGGIVLHGPGCPRDKFRGRDTNDFVVDCTAHDDRDDPQVWARSNPAFGIRVEQETFDGEIRGMDFLEFNREILNVGEWPARDAPWKVVDKDRWEDLVTEYKGTVPPVVFAVDVAEDNTSASIGASWLQGSGKDARVIVTLPRGCNDRGTDWVMAKLKELYSEWKPMAVVVPKSGPAAGLGDDIENLWGDRVVRPGSMDEAAAFAWFTQQVEAGIIGHPPLSKAEKLYSAIGNADVRLVGDAGKALKRRDSTSDITPATTAILASWLLNKKRRNYDPVKGVG